MFYVFRSFTHPLGKIKRRIWMKGARFALPIGLAIGYWINPIILSATGNL